MADKSSLKKKILDILDEEFTKESKAESYTSSYNIPFDVDESILNDLKNELESHGIPNINNVGVGLTFARSLPYTNGNGLGMTAKCIKNSLDTIRFAQFDFQHYQNENMGTMLGLKTYDDTDQLIPEKPMRVFGLGALRRKTLDSYGINIKDLPTWGTSLEVAFGDFDFWYKGKVVLKENADPDWLLHVDDIIDGIPYFWESARVCIIAGGIDEDAVVNFNGNALTMNPADKEAGILLAVAEHKYPIFVVNNEEKEQESNESELNKVMPFKSFETEADLNTFVAQVKSDYKTELKVDQLQADLNTANTSITDFTTKLSTAEATITTLTTRAETAEAKLQEQAVAKLVETRKQTLASKNYEVKDEDKDDLDFIATASEDDFTKFVKRIEKAQASVKTNQATASQHEHEAVGSLGIDLTGSGSKSNKDENENKEVNLNVFI